MAEKMEEELAVVVSTNQLYQAEAETEKPTCWDRLMGHWHLLVSVVLPSVSEWLVVVLCGQPISFFFFFFAEC